MPMFTAPCAIQRQQAATYPRRSVPRRPTTPVTSAWLSLKLSFLEFCGFATPCFAAAVLLEVWRAVRASAAAAPVSSCFDDLESGCVSRAPGPALSSSITGTPAFSDVVRMAAAFGNVIVFGH